MPIRFRCVYCEKLLGIARRKAGAVVSCPHCKEKLIVPTPSREPNRETPEEEEDKGTAEDRALDPDISPPLFERSDFENLLQPEPTFRSGDDEPIPSTTPSRPSGAPEPAPAPFPYEPKPYVSPPVAPLPSAAPAPATPQPGFYLSPSKLTWLSVTAVIALALAFGAGLMIGRMMK